MCKTVKVGWNIPAFFLMLVVGFALASCDNKDDDVTPPVESPFVGIWLCNVDTWAFQLNSDGTGVEYLAEDRYFYNDDITWTYNTKTQYLVVYGTDGDKSWGFKIFDISDSQFTAMEDGNTIYTFEKQSNLSFLSDWDWK